MKYLFILFLFVSTLGNAQLTMEASNEIQSRYDVGSYSYHEEFKGHPGYGAPIILTADGGMAIFGDSEDSVGIHGLLAKLDKTGKEQWKRIIRPQFDNLESQSVVQDKAGNFYVFIISYDQTRYRGGSQRIVCMDKTGKILWDKTIGKYDVMNNPSFSYIRALSDGRIALRGHIVTEKPVEGKDPIYHYWEGWINYQGKLTQKTGAVLDWSKPEWKKLFKPE